MKISMNSLLDGAARERDTHRLLLLRDVVLLRPHRRAAGSSGLAASASASFARISLVERFDIEPFSDFTTK